MSMKRTMTVTLLLTLSVLLSLVSLPSPVQGDPRPRFSADTGLIIPGPHQRLRLTVTGMGNTTLTVRFREMQYMPETCNPNTVCKLTISSQYMSAPITLGPGEAASLDLLATTYGRGSVISNSQDAKVTLQIIDTETGQVDSVLIALLLP